MIALLLLLATSASAQRVIYVDTDAAGANDGTSWANAYVYLQDALAAAQAGDEIWVAEGDYRPREGAGTNGNWKDSFELRSGVALYGGFSGSETSRNGRDWIAHRTVLDGSGEPSRSLHVVTSGTVDRTAVLDGFVIAAGSAWDSASAYRVNQVGGGLFNSGGSPTLRNLRFELNQALSAGGAVYSSGGHPLVVRCTFSLNQVRSNGGATGGAIHQEYGSISIVNSKFMGNMATGVASGYEKRAGHGRGGAVSIENASASIVNSLFVANWVAGEHVYASHWVAGSALGGGVSAWQSTVAIVNGTFSGNVAMPGTEVDNEGGAIWSSGSMIVRHGLLWTNEPDEIGGELADADASIIRGGYTGAFILDEDPQFMDPVGVDLVQGTEDDDYRLQKSSPAIDRGDIGFLPPDSFDLDGDGDTTEWIPFDLAGFERVWATRSDLAIPDMGAYESDVILYAVEEPPFPRPDVRLEVFPNPSSDYVTVRYGVSRGDRVRVSLLDVLGRELETLDDRWSSPGEHSDVLHLGDLPPGIYIVQVVSGGLLESRTLVITR
jgi:hypothetical protein